MSAEDTAPKQRKVVGKPFAPGQSGNPAGRPKGARSKLAESFLEDLYKDWQESGLVTLQHLRAEKPEVYVKVIADLLPKQEEATVNVNHSGTVEHRTVSETAAWVAGLLGERAEGSSSEPLSH